MDANVNSIVEKMRRPPVYGEARNAQNQQT
jgi:hypothetical protein